VAVLSGFARATAAPPMTWIAAGSPLGEQVGQFREDSADLSSCECASHQRLTSSAASR
jgi:hypothetical protein